MRRKNSQDHGIQKVCIDLLKQSSKNSSGGVKNHETHKSNKKKQKHSKIKDRILEHFKSFQYNSKESGKIQSFYQLFNDGVPQLKNSNSDAEGNSLKNSAVLISCPCSYKKSREARKHQQKVFNSSATLDTLNETDSKIKLMEIKWDSIKKSHNFEFRSQSSSPDRRGLQSNFIAQNHMGNQFYKLLGTHQAKSEEIQKKNVSTTNHHKSAKFSFSNSKNESKLKIYNLFQKAESSHYGSKQKVKKVARGFHKNASSECGEFKNVLANKSIIVGKMFSATELFKSRESENELLAQQKTVSNILTSEANAGPPQKMESIKKAESVGKMKFSFLKVKENILKKHLSVEKKTKENGQESGASIYLRNHRSSFGAQLPQQKLNEKRSVSPRIASSLMGSACKIDFQQDSKNKKLRDPTLTEFVAQDSVNATNFEFNKTCPSNNIGLPNDQNINGCLQSTKTSNFNNLLKKKNSFTRINEKMLEQVGNYEENVKLNKKMLVDNMSKPCTQITSKKIEKTSIISGVSTKNIKSILRDTLKNTINYKQKQITMTIIEFHKQKQTQLNQLESNFKFELQF